MKKIYAIRTSHGMYSCPICKEMISLARRCSCGQWEHEMKMGKYRTQPYQSDDLILVKKEKITSADQMNFINDYPENRFDKISLEEMLERGLVWQPRKGWIRKI